MKQVPKLYFPSLYGLRALSILFVIFSHTVQHYISDTEHPVLFNTLFQCFFSDGHFGVNVFFVISGFLISAILQKEEETHGFISLKNFYVKRLLRIFPAYYFLLLVYFLLQLLHYIHIPSNAWLTAITYTKYFNINSDWLTRHAWSLSIEEQFYVFFPLLFFLKPQARKIIILSLIIFVPFLRIFFIYVHRDYGHMFSIFYRIDAICFGVALTMYKDTLISFFEKITWRTSFLIACILLVLIPIINNIPYDYHYILVHFNIAFNGNASTIANIAICIFVMYSVYGPKNKWYSFLNSNYLKFIGVLSYSLYLWQQFFLQGNAFLITSFPLNLVCLFLVSCGSYYFIEKPFLKLKALL